jgi:subtilisin family serine protease
VNTQPTRTAESLTAVPLLAQPGHRRAQRQGQHLPQHLTMLAAAIALLLSTSASALSPSDRYFAAPPASPATFDGYQYALHPGWMNFVEAWDYHTGSARIAVTDGGASLGVGDEYSLPHFGSWDFGSRKEDVCPLTQFFGNGCGAQPQAVPPDGSVAHVYVAVPRQFFFGLLGDTDLTKQTQTGFSTGPVFIPGTGQWQDGYVVNFEETTKRVTSITGQAVHGTHVYSTIKARHNNAQTGGVGGTAGACPDCQVLSTRVNVPDLQTPDLTGQNNQGPDINAKLFSQIDALQWTLLGGAQVVSASFGADLGAAPCNPQAYVGGESDWCTVLRTARSFDVLFFAAAGNDMVGVDSPARDPMAIAVGGVDLQKRLWDERLQPQEYFDQTGGCPLAYNKDSPYTTNECGSNSGPELDFVAPARHILSLVPPGRSYVEQIPAPSREDPPIEVSVGICGDDTFGGQNDGVGYCTGTSMATPLMAAAGGLLRSVNPLLQRDAVYEALKSAADGNGQFSSRGWGMPNVGTAVKRVLGTSGRVQMVNRLTPMFVMRMTGDRLYTVAPQLAVSAWNGWFAQRPYLARNPSEYAFGNGATADPGPAYRLAVSAEAAPVRLRQGTISGNTSDRQLVGPYAYPGLESNVVSAHASFYVFSGKRSVFGVALRPLVRLLSSETCDVRENTFVHTRNCPNANGSESGEWRTFHEDGIEGYLLATCPAEFAPCTNTADPSIPQAVYLRYSATAKSFALLLASQLSEPQFANYLPIASRPASTAPLGYAFKNVDTDGDGLIDGQERLLGTNRLTVDSDCDGLGDGTEYPTLQLQSLQMDPRVGPCGMP